MPRLEQAHERGWWLWRGEKRGEKRRKLSPLLVRILIVNVVALAILVGSVLYLGGYQERLIAAELESMLMQARLSASALGEGAVVMDEEDRTILSPLLARMMVRRLVEGSETRVRLFDVEQTLLADSRILLGRGGKVAMEELPPPDGGVWLERKILGFLGFVDGLIERADFPSYAETTAQDETIAKAIGGDVATKVWRIDSGKLLLSVAVPVQRYRQVLGAIALSRPDHKIDAAVRDVRLDILRIFSITLLITIMLSLYLARAIALPLRMLAHAAERMRVGQTEMAGLVGTASRLESEAIPDYSVRNDEIGDLSAALRDLTGALARRVGAIENFAADVAHELKNPLTSMRSAVETAERVADPEMRKKLMAVIRDDVDRMDRLISDISSASRLDAELGRAETAAVDIGKMLLTLQDIHGQQIEIRQPLPEGLFAMGVEGRLMEVLRNLVANAVSFSPLGKNVVMSAARESNLVKITVEDEGPGVPENKLDAIFDRFYSERPKTEKFGTHSGLGLSISRQIISAHGGKIWAENRRNDAGKVLGARFTFTLPLLAPTRSFSD